MDLERGRVAVVTGAAGGIGLEIARGLSAAGLRVVMTDIDGDRLLEAASSVEGAVTVVADVSSQSEDGIGRITQTAFALGEVQVLVSNAAIVRGGPVWELPAEAWRQVIDVNLMASVNLLRAFLPRLIEQGSPAHVLVTGSMGSVTVRAGNGPYSVAKHGLLALAETTRDDLVAAGHPIGVTILMPGLVATPMTGAYAADNPEAITAAEAATVALEAIAANQLFAFTQPDRLDGVRERFASILPD